MIDTLVGRSAGNGAFSIDRWIMSATSCGRLLGHDHKTGQPVHIGITRPASVTPAELNARLAYQVPGVASCLFIGTLDAPSGIEDHVIVVEEVGRGKALTQCAADLDSRNRLQVAQQIGHTLVHAERQGIALGGLHPDLVWLDESSGVRAILAPRFPVLLAVKKKQRMVGEAPWPFSDVGPFIDPMMLNPWHATSPGDAYCFGLLIAWLFSGKQPFAEAAHRGNNAWLSAMADDERDPFSGPSAIGKILDDVLVAEPSRRMPIGDVVAALGAVRLEVE
ncbi:MAG: hypothetical protein ABIY55_03090 [Kofleriaceae bacterium]